LADAAAEGWSAQRAADWIAEHAREPSAESLPTSRQATRVSVLDDWRQRLLWGKRDLLDCRENVYLILHHHPEWSGIIAVDEFAKRVIKRRATPWGPAGEWEEVDDLRLGLWLAQRDDLRLLVRSQANLSGGVNMAAHDARFHPVREWYDSLRWDGIARLDHWIEDYMDVTVGSRGHDPEYLRLVGRFFIMGMVARIYEPGCVFRMMPIFEGEQNKGKSSALRALAQPWFADTPFALGDKDAFQVIQGVLLYEIAELDSFNKSESTRIKAFISSISDKFRAPYEARPREHQRQTVFAGTTNSDEYFKDSTGNTRFAPVACGSAIRYEELGGVRDQLFAEAIALYRAGQRRYATRAEEERYFLPEQQRREIADPWFEVIWRWLDKGTMGRVTLAEVISDCLKIEMERVDNARQMATRIGIAMKRAGWRKGRLGAGERSYYWERPGSEESPGARVQQVGREAGDAPF
jgi:predicted P-loop ATPase